MRDLLWIRNKWLRMPEIDDFKKAITGERQLGERAQMGCDKLVDYLMQAITEQQMQKDNLVMESEKRAEVEKKRAVAEEKLAAPENYASWTRRILRDHARESKVQSEKALGVENASREDHVEALGEAKPNTRRHAAEGV